MHGHFIGLKLCVALIYDGLYRNAHIILYVQEVVTHFIYSKESRKKITVFF